MCVENVLVGGRNFNKFKSVGVTDKCCHGGTGGGRVSVPGPPVLSLLRLGSLCWLHGSRLQDGGSRPLRQAREVEPRHVQLHSEVREVQQTFQVNTIVQLKVFCEINFN